MTKVVYKELGTGEVKEKFFATAAGAAYWVGTFGKLLTEGIIKVEFNATKIAKEVA